MVCHIPFLCKLWMKVFLDNFRSFVHDLLLEHSKESNFKGSDPLKKSFVINTTCMKAIMNYLIATSPSNSSHFSHSEVDHNVDNCMLR